MDNVAIHGTLEVMKLFADNKLKVVYNIHICHFLIWLNYVLDL